MKTKQKVYKLDIRATLLSLDVDDVVVFESTEAFPGQIRLTAYYISKTNDCKYKVSQNSITKEIAVKRIH